MTSRDELMTSTRLGPSIFFLLLLLFGTTFTVSLGGHFFLFRFFKEDFEFLSVSGRSLCKAPGLRYERFSSMLYVREARTPSEVPGPPASTASHPLRLGSAHFFLLANRGVLRRHVTRVTGLGRAVIFVLVRLCFLFRISCLFTYLNCEVIFCSL